MIRYAIPEITLVAKVREKSKDWLRKSEERTEQIVETGIYQSHWSDIKQAFVDLQFGKCAYCETQLGADEIVSIVWDVEHYRPKGRIRQYKPPEALSDIRFTTPSASAKGYPHLAYSIYNYCSACKVCNSALKGDVFPITGRYSSLTTMTPDLAHVRQLNTYEKPSLLYPIGDIDIDPEDAIEFLVTVPIAKAGPHRDRARTTIAFFKLSDTARSQLLIERTRLITQAFRELELVANAGGHEVETAKRMLNILTADSAPHANCIRSFVRLYDSDRPKARQAFDAAVAYLESKSLPSGS